MTSLIIIVILILGVIFVNGWTDAPNAIATAISTRVISPHGAIRLAVIFNFLGAFVMSLINAKVANTLSNIVSFKPEENQTALVVLAAAMFSIVIWAVCAWYFGIPTSESHALIAGVTGAAIALGGFSSINQNEWSKVLIGLVLSTILGFGIGFLFSKFIQIVFFNLKRSIANKVFAVGQNFGAAAMAFMHGAQDGQKFMGIFLLCIYLFDQSIVNISSDNTFHIPIQLIFICSIVMGLGTSVGGYKIIKSVGMDMVRLEKYQGFVADTSAAICLLIASLTGIPVSTTHTKTTAIMGVGAAKRLSSVNWKIVKEMVIAWVLTFPGCGIIAFLMARLFLHIFS